MTSEWAQKILGNSSFSALQVKKSKRPKRGMPKIQKKYLYVTVYISADPWLSGGARLEVMCLRHLADGKHFVCLLESRVACVLLGMCPNPAAVRLFRNCASKGFLLMVLLAREDKRLLFCCFMDSKGDVKHFFGVRFAWHVPESCCCSSVSQLRLQGISAMVLLAREDKRLLFYGFQR